jgi:hypothetical protein
MCSIVCADRRRKDIRMTPFSHRALPSILLILWQDEIALNQPRLRLPEDCIMNQCERSRPGRFLHMLNIRKVARHKKSLVDPQSVRPAPARFN